MFYKYCVLRPKQSDVGKDTVITKKLGESEFYTRAQAPVAANVAHTVK